MRGGHRCLLMAMLPYACGYTHVVTALQPRSYAVTALVTCSHGLGYMRLQPRLMMVMVLYCPDIVRYCPDITVYCSDIADYTLQIIHPPVACGYGLGYTRLRPWSQAVTALVTCGQGLGHMRLQPRVLMVMILYCPDVVLYCPDVTLYCSDIIQYCPPSPGPPSHNRGSYCCGRATRAPRCSTTSAQCARRWRQSPNGGSYCCGRATRGSRCSTTSAQRARRWRRWRGEPRRWGGEPRQRMMRRWGGEPRQWRGGCGLHCGKRTTTWRWCNFGRAGTALLASR